MVTPTELWMDYNEFKYWCEACTYSSCNKTHYGRHAESIKHFLMTDIANAPLDIKAVIATFLPIRTILNLGDIGRRALRLDPPKTIHLRLAGRQLLTSLPAQIVVEPFLARHNQQTRVLILPPSQRRLFDLTTVA